jgi:hypothetical protein
MDTMLLPVLCKLQECLGYIKAHFTFNRQLEGTLMQGDSMTHSSNKVAMMK